MKSFKKCCERGYYFCFHCSRILSIGDEMELPTKCPRCKKRAVKWMPSVSIPEKQDN